MQTKGITPPQILTIAITGICNLSCRHCWVESTPQAATPHTPTDYLVRIIEEHASMGGTGLRITGGEPLCHPACIDLLELAVKAGLRSVILQTNGMLITDDVIAGMGMVDFPGLSFEISLDGATAAKHDLVRGSGSFEQTLLALERLQRAGLQQRINILFTEMHHNLEDFPGILALAERNGFNSVQSGTLIKGGRAATDKALTQPGPEQYRDLLNHYLHDRDFRERYDRIGMMAPIEWLNNRTQHPNGNCMIAADPYLTADGSLYPCRVCHSKEFSISGVFQKGLAASFLKAITPWLSLLRIHSRRKDANAICHGCPLADSCAAGCMGRACASTGTPMGVDDRCALRRCVEQVRTSAKPADI